MYQYLRFPPGGSTVHGNGVSTAQHLLLTEEYNDYMDEFLHIAEHTLGHTVSDTLYLIPILFVTYLVMEWIEHSSASKTHTAVRRAGAAGPLVGAFLGAVPQCGFSAMGATLYAGRVITLGTLFAVFLSTSDEMLPIFIAEQVPLHIILSILLTKICIGMVAGFVIDAMIRIANRDKQDFKIHELCEHDRCGCINDCETCKNDPKLVYEHKDDCSDECNHPHHSHHHDHDHEGALKQIVFSALKHTIQVFIFIFIITLVLNGVLETVGEDTLADVLSDNAVLSVFASGLVGLIPNCAASIVIAELYLEGVLSAGAMLSGLLVSAGVGLLVLVRTNHHWRQNVAIIVGLYAIGVLFGLIVFALGITF